MAGTEYKDRMAGMENITGVSLVPLTTSRYLSPLRMEFRQASRARAWDLMRCHDSVAIVIFNTTEQRFVLVRQFRPAVYISVAGRRLGCELGPGSKVDTATVPPSLGFTLELCAGIVDKPELSLAEVAREEVEEECGYRVPADRLTKIIRDCTLTSISSLPIFISTAAAGPYFEFDINE